MEKRLALAIALCFLIVLGYSMLLEKWFPKTPATDPTRSSATGAPAAPPATGVTPAATSAAKPAEAESDPATPAPPPRPEHPERIVQLVNSELELDLHSRGASITGARLTGRHLEDDRSGPVRVLAPEFLSGGALLLDLGEDQRALATEHWELLEHDAVARRAVFRNELAPGRFVRKTIQLPAGGYFIEVELLFEGTGWEQQHFRFFGPERLRLDRRTNPINSHVTAYCRKNGELMEVVRRNVAETGQKFPDTLVDKQDLLWSGVVSNFFAWVMLPEKAAAAVPARHLVVRQTETTPAADRTIQSLPYEVGIAQPVVPGAPERFRIFCGPKERELLAEHAGIGFDQLVDYGSYFGWLVKIFLMFLHGFEWLIGSWGVAIVLLTVLVKIALHPLNRKNQAVMMTQQKKMAKVQPQLRELNERYKGDPLRMRREQQKIFKEHDINPAQLFGGCLLIFLQIPIWVALISTFSLDIDLRQEGFLWVRDLTAPDQLWKLPGSFNIPLIGTMIGEITHLNALPILYVIVTIINQKLMPKPTDPQALQQHKMMTFMMVFFGFIFYNFSAGLLVYFLTSAALGILEQKIIRKELERSQPKL